MSHYGSPQPRSNGIVIAVILIASIVALAAAGWIAWTRLGPQGAPQAQGPAPISAPAAEAPPAVDLALAAEAARLERERNEALAAASAAQQQIAAERAERRRLEEQAAADRAAAERVRQQQIARERNARDSLLSGPWTAERVWADGQRDAATWTFNADGTMHSQRHGGGTGQGSWSISGTTVSFNISTARYTGSVNGRSFNGTSVGTDGVAGTFSATR